MNLSFYATPSIISPGVDRLLVTFWGVRGSYPSPGKETLRYGGNTACVEISAGGHTIILDAGTGLIPLGRDLTWRAQRTGRPVTATLLFSHLHHDHLQGFPFFAPAYAASTRLAIFGPRVNNWDLQPVLDTTMTLPFFPLSFQRLAAASQVRSLPDNQAIVWPEPGSGPVVCPAGSAVEKALRLPVTPGNQAESAVSARLLWSDTHPGGVLFYRIAWRGHSVVYATDTECPAGVDPCLADFARGADLLIHDAQYTPQHYQGLLPGMGATRGWGHSTVEMACVAARSAGVKALALFHHEPAYPDETIDHLEAAAQERFPGAFAAYEGLQVGIGAEISLGEAGASLWQSRQSAAPVQLA